MKAISYLRQLPWIEWFVPWSLGTLSVGGALLCKSFPIGRNMSIIWMKKFGLKQILQYPPTPVLSFKIRLLYRIRRFNPMPSGHHVIVTVIVCGRGFGVFSCEHVSPAVSAVMTTGSLYIYSGGFSEVLLLTSECLCDLAWGWVKRLLRGN